VGVLFGAVFLYFAMTTPVADRTTFFVLMCLTAIFMPFSSPNVISTVFDISLPEVRSSAQAVEYFVENSGAALAPTIAGALILALGSKQQAIMLICLSAWALCFVLYLGAMFFVKRDISTLRASMAERAAAEKSRQPA
jgi:predicted MFS family arabinose efflux permease